jgi:hypothetical protein
MKKTFVALFLSILLLTGCGPHWQVTKPEFKDGQVVQDGQVVSLEQLTEKSGANVVRAFTALTGGGTGALDKISRTTITNGDIAMVVTGNIIYFYQYNSAATDAESSPTFIRPNDYATSGVWYLVDVRAKGVNTGTSTTPSLDFYDSDAADGDINAKIYVNCTTTTSGAENCEMYFQNQVGGTLATRLTIDASGNIIALGNIMGLLGETAVASARAITTAELRGAWMTVDTNRTLTMPAATVGLNGCFEALTAAIFVLTPASGENWVLNGTAKAANATISSPATAGAFVCVHCAVAGTWRTMGMSGTFTSP